MDLNSIQKLAVRNTPFLIGYEHFVNIEYKYILGNGILIDNAGQQLWNTPWSHGYFNQIYYREKGVIFTDRFAMPGPATLSLGVCCISIDTGKYIWKHWYDNGLDERLALRKREPDINLVGSIGQVEDDGSHLITGGFRIKICDGSYEYIGGLDNRGKAKTSVSVIYPKEVQSYKKNREEQSIHFGVREAIIQNQKIEKEQYFFNKCNAVINKAKNIIFFGVPAKKNQKGAILFNYSTISKKIEQEIELPFRGEIIDVYDFFGEGIMIYELTKEKEKVYSLWFISNDLLEG